MSSSIPLFGRTDPVRTEPQDNADYPEISAGLGALADVVRDLGLERNVLELEMNGYTVVPGVLHDSEVASLRADLVGLAAADSMPVDEQTGASHRDRTQEVCLLFARGGPIMRSCAENTKTLVLVRYLLGTNCVLSSFTGYVKGPGACALGVHSDTAYVPDPLPPYAQLANVNFLLSDYTPATGCLTMVPGSHRYCHRPREGLGEREAIPVIARAGSAVVFHGNTWHSALPRSADGIRLTLSILYSRLYMRPQENYAEALTADEQATLSEELRSLVVPELPTGWSSLDEARAMTARRKDRSRTYYRTRGQHV